MNVFTLIQPVITEKTLKMASEQGVYTFFVNPRATKGQVLVAVQEAFHVDVTDVHTSVLPPAKKKTARGKKSVQKSTQKRKKALVTLKKGQKIDLFDLKG